MCANDQVSTHMVRIIAIQIKTSVTIRVYYYKKILSYYIKTKLELSQYAQHTTSSRVVETPARRTLHRGTPHLHHLMNIIGGMESKVSVSTLIVGTPQALGTYDMKRYKPRSKHDMVNQKASYT
jgi:hypothetical protein